MRRTPTLLVLVTTAAAWACARGGATATPAPATPSAPAGAASGATAAGAARGAPGGGMAMVAPDSFVAERDSLSRAVLASIAGREQQPAESVFKNIKRLNGVPAARLLRTMNAFGRSLGVSCSHCHVVGEWASEDKPQKQVARDMMAMAQAINQDYLSKIPNLRSPRPSVSCSTCHRGQPRPGANEQQQGPRPGGPGSPGGA